jgi:hypothetical protein
VIAAESEELLVAFSVFGDVFFVDLSLVDLSLGVEPEPLEDLLL